MESDAQQGLSHFLEHMAFKGTKTRSALEIAEAIEAVGKAIEAMMKELSGKKPDFLIKDRREKFLDMGAKGLAA